MEPMGSRLVIVDADLLASWRRAAPSLEQLHQAVDALADQEPDATIAVVADAALKWDLTEPERERIERDIAEQYLLLAPAGCAGGHVGFMARIVEQAVRDGWEPVVITARSVPGAPLGRPNRREGRWEFDLDAPQPTIVASGQPVRRRRRRGPGAAA